MAAIVIVSRQIRMKLNAKNDALADRRTLTRYISDDQGAEFKDHIAPYSSEHLI